jgi:hypothetical protein
MDRGDGQRKIFELSRMFEYYKSARKCHIPMSMEKNEAVRDPLEIVDNLKFIDHILSSMGGAALASEVPHLSNDFKHRLCMWANMEGEAWTFPLKKEPVRSAGVDICVQNCYSTCTRYIRLLFRNLCIIRVLDAYYYSELQLRIFYGC